MGRERELPPPLEMMCLNALWEVGEGNVEEVRRVVARSRPLAYTTVLTLLDRLARRGAVSRRKEGRGFRYLPTVARDRLRRMALRQFVESHFDGSVMKLRVFLEQPMELEAVTEAGVGAGPGSVARGDDSAPELTPMIEFDLPAEPHPVFAAPRNMSAEAGEIGKNGDAARGAAASSGAPSKL